MARPALSTHRKFVRLAQALGSRVIARGTLELLWDHCAEAGDPYVGTREDIEAVCEWTGARGALTTALLDAGAPHGAGFIEPYEGDVRDTTPHYQIHHFFLHCPAGVRRAMARRREEAPLPLKICVFCGGEYPSRSPVSKCCGDACRKAAHRAAYGRYGHAPRSPFVAPKAHTKGVFQ